MNNGPESPHNNAPELRRWNRKLNIHGEFLMLASLACYSAPIDYFIRFLAMFAVVFVFWRRVQDDRRLIPDSLRRLKANPTKTPEEQAMLDEIDDTFFTWGVSRHSLQIYLVGFIVWLVMAGHTTITSFLCNLPIK